MPTKSLADLHELLVPRPLRVAQAAQNNGPNYWIAFTGIWGEPEVATCMTPNRAALVAHSVNGLKKAVDVMEEAKRAIEEGDTDPFNTIKMLEHAIAELSNVEVPDGAGE